MLPRSEPYVLVLFGVVIVVARVSSLDAAEGVMKEGGRREEGGGEKNMPSWLRKPEQAVMATGREASTSTTVKGVC